MCTRANPHGPHTIGGSGLLNLRARLPSLRPSLHPPVEAIAGVEQDDVGLGRTAGEPLDRCPQFSRWPRTWSLRLFVEVDEVREVGGAEVAERVGRRPGCEEQTRIHFDLPGNVRKAQEACGAEENRHLRALHVHLYVYAEPRIDADWMAPGVEGEAVGFDGAIGPDGAGHDTVAARIFRSLQSRPTVDRANRRLIRKNQTAEAVRRDVSNKGPEVQRVGLGAVRAGDVPENHAGDRHQTAVGSNVDQDRADGEFPRFSNRAIRKLLLAYESVAGCADDRRRDGDRPRDTLDVDGGEVSRAVGRYGFAVGCRRFQQSLLVSIRVGVRAPGLDRP